VVRAALLELVHGARPGDVNIPLPAGQTAQFSVRRERTGAPGVRYATVKDAGDDPDVTDGATVWARVRPRPRGGVAFEAGRGVGTVTLPGLPVEPGEAAINPVPRRMMRGQVEELLGEHHGALVEVGVVDGLELAQRTLNARLGIREGLSILGTTGIVIPYSHASYVASIEQGIDVAHARGHSTLVLTTGGRTEAFAMERLNVPETAFVQFGTFLEEALEYLREHPFESLFLFMMPGKFSKLAQGHLRLHSDDVRTDMQRVRRDVRELLGPEDPRREELGRARSVNQTLDRLDGREQTRLLREPAAPARTFQVTVLSLEGRTLASASVYGGDGA